MMGYEIKKVFTRKSSQIALLLMLVLTGITCFLATDIYYVDGNGNRQRGPAAIAALKADQKEWAGYLDEEKIRQVIRENNRIVHSPEYNSGIRKESEAAYSRVQGIKDIRDLLNYAYAKKFREYDYYRADSLKESDAPDFYANRIRLLKNWLEEEEAGDQFPDVQKAYLISQYEKLKTPLYTDYMTGWRQFAEYAPTIVMISMLILGYLVAGIFSNEFAWKSDAVFFSSAYGRKRAVWNKIKAGTVIVTGIYVTVVALYSLLVLLYLGADGWGLAIQADWVCWKSFYNLTIWQKYLLIVIGGYIGCLFISLLSMYVSAKTNSAVLAVMVPFLLIFLPSFLEGIGSAAVRRVTGLLPDQLLQMGMAVRYFNLYKIGGKVVGAVPILLVLYAALSLGLLPVIYREYSRKQAG